MRREPWDPNLYGCPGCSNGAEICVPEDARCQRPIVSQSREASEQGPFKAPANAFEFAELGMLAVPMKTDRRYRESGVYCSPAEEEAIRLNRVEEAVLENVLAADTQGLLTSGDMVNLPAHYARFKIEPIRFIVENGLNWFQGNIVKYGSRAQHKHATPLEDISKINRYAEMWYDFESGDPDWWLPRGHPQRKPVLA